MILKKKYIITFITLLIILIIIKTHNSENLYFPIKNVTSSELINVNKDDISEAVKYLYSKSFFDIDLNYLKNKLEKIEWVRKINIRRSYPNEIIIDFFVNLFLIKVSSILNKNFSFLFCLLPLHSITNKLQPNEFNSSIIFFIVSLLTLSS